MLPSGWTPLMYATSGANVKLTQELLDRGANPNFQKGKDPGPVVQNFVSLMLSLGPQPVNYISTSKANTLLFFIEKM